MLQSILSLAMLSCSRQLLEVELFLHLEHAELMILYESDAHCRGSPKDIRFCLQAVRMSQRAHVALNCMYCMLNRPIRMPKLMKSPWLHRLFQCLFVRYCIQLESLLKELHCAFSVQHPAANGGQES